METPIASYFHILICQLRGVSVVMDGVFLNLRKRLLDSTQCYGDLLRIAK